jgi:hypothetical protein
MKKTLAVFILVGSSLLGLSKINAQTAPSGTLTANPQNVTAFTNENGSGNTKLSWSTANSPRTLITLTKTRKNGSLLSAETVVINNNVATGSRDINYIQKDVIHTFKLFTATGTSNTDYVKGALLATSIVNGYDPAAR